MGSAAAANENLHEHRNNKGEDGDNGHSKSRNEESAPVISARSSKAAVNDAWVWWTVVTAVGSGSVDDCYCHHHSYAEQVEEDGACRQDGDSSGEAAGQGGDHGPECCDGAED